MRNIVLLASVAMMGCAPNYYVANVYDNGGTLYVERCTISPFNGRPNPSDCSVNPVGDSTSSPSRYSAVEDVTPIPRVDLKPVVVNRARYRTAAIELARRADEAARASDCSTARSRAEQVDIVDHDYYSTVVLRDSMIKACM